MKTSPIHFERCDFSNQKHAEKLTELLNHYMQDPMGDSIPLDASQQQQLIAGLASNPKAFVVFVLYEKEIVGFSTIFELFSTFKVKPYLYIHDFVVSGAYRGKKLGRALMDEIARIAKDMNCCKITLEVRIDNDAAKKLYQNCGFFACEPDMHFWTKMIN